MNHFQYYILHSLAHEAYRDKQYDLAVGYFSQCLKIKREAGDKVGIIQSQFWKAECLSFIGQYRQALTECLEIISYNYPIKDKGVILYTYSLIIQMSVRLPVSAAAIEHSLVRIETFINQNGKSHWFSTYYYLKALYLYRKCLYDEAYNTAMQGWAIWQMDYPSFFNDEYFHLILAIKTATRDIEGVAHHIDTWQNLENHHPMWREVMLNEAKINYLRLTHAKEEALNLARKIINYERSAALLLQLTGLYLANGYLSEAKSTLVEFVRRFRNSSSLFERLDVYRLIGDYHYSCVRNRLQLSTFDCDFGNQDLATLNLTTNQLATNKVLLTEYRKTLANYTNALEIARSVDKLLDTTGYETMILARLQWINVTPK